MTSFELTTLFFAVIHAACVSALVLSARVTLHQGDLAPIKQSLHQHGDFICKAAKVGGIIEVLKTDVLYKGLLWRYFAGKSTGALVFSLQPLKGDQELANQHAPKSCQGSKQVYYTVFDTQCAVGSAGGSSNTCTVMVFMLGSKIVPTPNAARPFKDMSQVCGVKKLDKTSRTATSPDDIELYTHGDFC
ncbi:hypothetical protein BCR37DRAFT_406113 [Protomyces lactucae-debilis]|uniref:Uncharacterized protein n=1 Tax=Protomyces lactucae-debilis TaxID=2754530 RepID=A0A1Y2EZG0_PROLT|nr:uncharacterized protein BCR37DRAFT_406113 [Protomyces lactucae-debilis]ORY76654.1 hypothetical protein BCR37DRAFT_406113 [Protomyces lactucae-debilis]